MKWSDRYLEVTKPAINVHLFDLYKIIENYKASLIKNIKIELFASKFLKFRNKTIRNLDSNISELLYSKTLSFQNIKIEKILNPRF